MRTLKIAIAATFTAEPLMDSLAFWSDKLQWSAEIAFAPYNQVFQELLNPSSLLATNHSGINVVLVRPQDWQNHEQPESARPAELRDNLQRTAQEFVTAVQAAAARSATPYLVCLCPGSPLKRTDIEISGVEQYISDQLSTCPGVHLLRSEDVTSMYPVNEYYDRDRDEMGHIPYTTEFFSALGTAITRRIYSLQQNSYKVIVTDCDETLWKGVCAEVGPEAVEIDAGRRALQEFLARQQAAGMLICLCSKNVEEDIDEVFRCHPAMPLQPEHIIARRVNWQPKPQNLRELAAELQLGLDTFIFIDDNPLECEQVKSACPEVLTLQLPASGDIPNFLRNVWAFDKHNITDEDRRRTSLYRENQERDRFRQQAPTLAGFLEGLQLKIDIAPVTPEQLPRIAQLTQRTNQFNFTTLRRTEEQIRQLLHTGKLECLAVQVSDRFGDYGLVGTIMFRSSADAMRVDTFLLSCRALGRGVEHAMLRTLGEYAGSRNLAWLDLDFRPSKKNAPARVFLESVAADFKETNDQGHVFRVPAAYAARLSAQPMVESAEAPPSASEPEPRTSSNLAVTARSELVQGIATELGDVEAILRSLRKKRGFAAASPRPETKPIENPYRHAVAEAWTEVLGVTDLGPEHDFFALGGDSLLATQVISRLRQLCGVRLHLGDLFNYPTVSALASLIQNAKVDQQASNTQHPQEATAVDRITPRSTLDPCALSFSQQRWWFLNQWAPGTADHLSLVLRFRGALNREALQHSLNYVLLRHQVLRTTYVLSDGSPVQVASPSAELLLPSISLTGLPAAEREDAAVRILEQQFRQAFDLSHDSILRASLLEFAPDDHALVLVMHHIASDGWSRGIFLRELEFAYQAYVRRQEPALPELPVQYADFSLWQRRQMTQGALDDQLAYWKQRLAGAPILQLPTDRPRPSAPDLREGVHTRVLSAKLLHQLHTLAQQENATLFMTLLAAFQTLLYRYTGQQDIIVGSPVAGRNHPDTEALIGCFINMVAFRAQVASGASFREFLAQVRQLALEAQDRQEVPFERLVEELEHGRDMSRAPIFQAVFALENLLAVPEFPGLQVELKEVETRSAFHDLSLFVAEQTDGLRLRFEYRTDLFDPPTIERMADHFANLLAAIAADPNQKVGLLPMLGESERHELLYRWNDARQYPVTTCIHTLFQEQANRVPGNTALVFENQEMAYAELNARSNQLARYLVRMGIAPDVLVGLCMERSLDLVIAILGILKAGGAYLPLDPRYPKDRLAFMVDDAKPPIVITQYDLKESLPDINGQVIALDAEWSEIERESSTDFPCGVRPEHLAYVIYTSGSTGRPKGCQITHANVVRLFAATQEWFQFDERDVWTMFHSYAFDFSVWELWGALIYGGKLIIVPYLVSRSPEDFYRLLQTGGVTVLNQTPSSFRQLMHAEEQIGSTRPLALRYVIFGGEALEMQSLKPWFERHGDQQPRLVNMYGITETTVHVTYRPLAQNDANGGSVIGQPIPDLQVYILDSNLQPAPVGVPGEMYVGGAGVARGYLNRPDLNRERFVPDAFLPGENRRLYKSGDQARRLANGDIEYLGRVDQQVKIRGFRIELGEIESALTQHPGVRESVVLVNTDRGERRLVAYLVPQNGQAPPTAELYGLLKDQLPEYMIPAAFVTVDRMPLTSNGKIDRQALPQADFSRAGMEAGFVEPRTPLEQEVAHAWKEVLGLPQVSVNDNFFEIGGHSLLATRVIILLRTRLGLNFSLRLLFENPTVAGMACALIDPLIEHADEQEVTRIIEEVEALTDEAARAMRANSSASASDSSTPESLSVARS